MGEKCVDPEAIGGPALTITYLPSSNSSFILDSADSPPEVDSLLSQ